MGFFEEIYIEKYRGISNLNLKNLNRINLIVGMNNCGKTSVLEAIQLLRPKSDIGILYKVARQRDSLSYMNSNSLFDNFICMFSKNDDEIKHLAVSGFYNGDRISYDLTGTMNSVFLDADDIKYFRNRNLDVPGDDVLVDAFDGKLRLEYMGVTELPVQVNQYSLVTLKYAFNKYAQNIVYISPFDHLRGSIINKIIRNEEYKKVCLEALKLFDPDIEDMMIFQSDTGNRPVDYLRHRTLGYMPLSSYGDGIKKVLSISNAIAAASGGVLLIDEIETSIHKRFYDDIFSFLVKASKAFDVQVFITTHSIEAIDGILATQAYDSQNDQDDICACTIKKTPEGSLSRILSGREVYKNREAFGFEVRL